MAGSHSAGSRATGPDLVCRLAGRLLVRGKIDLFSLDALVNMASAAALHVEMRNGEAA